MTAAAQLAVPPAPVRDHRRQLEHWAAQCLRMERLLALAIDHVGERIPYIDPAVCAGVDALDALLEGNAALLRGLSKELADAVAADAG